MERPKPTPGHNNYFPILHKHLEQGCYELIACGPNTPTTEEIQLFATEANVRLPLDFIDFSVSQIGGIYIAVKEELWPRPKAYDVGPFWSFLYGLWVYGFATEIPEWMDIRIQTKKFRELTQSNFVPCLSIIGNANIYCFNPDGILHQYDHELNEFPPVNKTFLETLDYELAELAKRKSQKTAVVS